jgi:tRNA(Ile)-lysidine synthase TilS/MesJ
MVFLYSNPLIEKPSTSIKKYAVYNPVRDQPLNTDEEYRRIRDVIKKHSIEFSFIRFNATQ